MRLFDSIVQSTISNLEEGDYGVTGGAVPASNVAASAPGANPLDQASKDPNLVSAWKALSGGTPVSKLPAEQLKALTAFSQNHATTSATSTVANSNNSPTQNVNPSAQGTQPGVSAPH